MKQERNLDVDIDDAKKTLQNEWRFVEENPNRDFLDSDAYARIILDVRSVVRGKQVTYKYILLTSALAKVVNPHIHYRALQKGSRLNGAYDARSVAHSVIVPFEKSHGERLGGSNEPFLNRPARYPEFDMSNRDRNRDAQGRLYNLLEYCQVTSETRRQFPRDFLRQVLKEIMDISPTRQVFHVPSVQVSQQKTISIVREFLAVSGSGERLVAVCAALFSAMYAAANSPLDVIAYPVNWSDKFAKTAGDIEFRINKQVLKAAEAKDKPLTESDVRHCQMKAEKNSLTEYIILNGAGIISKDEQAISTFIESQLKEGLNLYILNIPGDLIPIFAILGEKGRRDFLDKVGTYLNEIKATRDNKTAWQSLLDKYL